MSEGECFFEFSGFFVEKKCLMTIFPRFILNFPLDFSSFPLHFALSTISKMSSNGTFSNIVIFLHNNCHLLPMAWLNFQLKGLKQCNVSKMHNITVKTPTNIDGFDNQR